MAYSLEFLEHIYEQCLNLPEEERVAFIERSCQSDADLKNTLLRMIRNNSNAIQYFQKLQQDVLNGIQDEPIPELKPGESVGNYRVLSFLAKGGMSNVYLAERVDGQFEQQVAIKCLAIKNTNSDDPFHQIGEQQILAKLRHPNIATLYDAGITAENVPYFIMEYIDGVPVDEYVALENFSLNKLLGIFEQVADAVAYAHAHLILHLDLKPGNILVTKEGKVKLLDFGIATAITSSKQGPFAFVGTPLIAAPEQIAGESLTAATDIYQLGMLLHKLLTGKLPYAEVTETREGITGKNLKETISRREISPSLNFELKAILAKCLEEEPEKRYAGVPLLLQDIRNYRTHFPVSAISPNIKYRLAKFARRNKTAVISFLLIGLSMIGGTAISLWQAKQAQLQRDLAQKSEQISLATKDFLLDLFMAAHPAKTKGDTMTVFQFLDKGYEEAEAYSGSPEIKLEMLTTIGKLYRALGDYTKSKKVLNNAYAVAKDSALQLSVSYILAIEELALYQRDIGNYDSAYVLMNQVLRMYSDINYPEKDSLFTASLKYQSFICKYLEKTDSAILLINRAIILEEQLWPNHNNINLAESYHVLGVIYKNQSQYEPAIEYLTKSLNLCESLMGTNFPGTMANLNALSGTLILAGDYDAALIQSKRATDIAIRLFGYDHKETATAIDNLGGVFLKLHSYDSAYFYYKSGLDIRQKIYPGQENQHLLYSNNNLLSLFIESQQADSAKKYLSDALQISTSEKIHARQRSFTYSLSGDYYNQLAINDSASYYYQKSISESMSYLPETDERIISVQKKLAQLTSIQ
jgi:eukaryotic-like serine/threonine-protein kinase